MTRSQTSPFTEPPSESVSRLVPSGEGAGSDGDAPTKDGAREEL